MTKIVRKDQKIFALGASNNGQFGSAQAGTFVTSADLDILQQLPAFNNGWSAATVSGEKLPPLEEFQSLDYINTYQLSYILQEGIAEYSVGTTYFQNSVVKQPGTYQLYGSLTDSNIGNDLTDPTNWEKLSNLSNNITVYVAGTTTGTPNAQVANTVPSDYTRSYGNVITWTAGFSNTGAMTLNFESTGAVSVKKDGTSGLVDPVALDVRVGESYQVIDNGTFYVLVSPSLPTFGTAASQNIGTSGGNVPLLNTANTWSLAQEFSVAIDAPSGGTGQSVYVIGDLLQASATNALSRLAAIATGNVLISGGVGVASAWGKVGLTTHVTGILAGTNGGTGVNNGASLMTFDGSIHFSGAFSQTIIATANTTVTLPNSGTLIGSSDVGTVTNTMLHTAVANSVKANATNAAASPTDVVLAASTLLGMGTAGSVAQIILGVGLAMTGTTLSATGATAATTAQQLAGTSNAVYTSPLTQQAHQSAAKAWVNWNGVGGATIRSSYNVSSVTYNGIGEYAINFTSGPSNTNYAFAIGGSDTGSASGTIGFMEGGKSTTSFQIFYAIPSTIAITDTNQGNVTFYWSS